MNIETRKIWLCILLVICISGIIIALQVAPGSFTTQNVPLGEAQDRGVSLVCSADGVKYVLAEVIPPEVETPRCSGYRALPDVDWFVLEAGVTLYIDSTGNARSKMSTNIPDLPELYNQHFVVRVFVTAEGGGMFQTAIIPYYFIETPPLENPTMPPAGELAVAPSVIDFTINDVTGSFNVYNNDTIAHNYRIEILPPENNSRQFPNASPGFSPIEKVSKISISSTKFKLNPRRKRELNVRWLDAAANSSKTEAIVLITADDGKQNFVRLKMEPE